MNISLVFPVVISCPVPMCRCSFDMSLIQSIFQEEFSKAKDLKKLNTQFQNFKKSNFLVGSSTCINSKHQFPNKIFKLIVEKPNNTRCTFTHDCEYCPSCYSFYWLCLQHYERIIVNKGKYSEESKDFYKTSY